jgi:peptide/nickel transport system ATP-binding protein
MSGPVISAEGVTVRFTQAAGWAERVAGLLGADVAVPAVHAVTDVSLDVGEGEVVGLVGESGCGKSTLGRVIAGILSPSQGRVRYRGADLATLAPEQRRRADLAVQMVFQDHAASLNPRLRIVEAVGEASVIHGLVHRQDQEDFVVEMMTRVGLDPSTLYRYPHQFSGGQRARICIARALAVSPSVLVCDESTAALDVSIQAQILNLFMRLREELRLTYVFVSHDLGVVAHIADRVAVMYLGRIVELAPVEVLFATPRHPYTQALLAQVPRLEAKKRRFAALAGEIPSPFAPPGGCHFHPRCPHAGPRCREERPILVETAPRHYSACHLDHGGVHAAAARALS